MAKKVSSRIVDAPPSALDQLLAAERDIAQRRAAVAAECATTIESARAAAVASDAVAKRTLDRELAALADDARRNREAAVRDIEAQADRAFARYCGLDAAEVDALAEMIAMRVTGLDARPATDPSP